MERRHLKPDPEKVRTQYAMAAYGTYAKQMQLNKEWEQLPAENKEAWKCATDETVSAILATLDGEEMFLVMLKLAMRDALAEDHLTQLRTQFTTPPFNKGGKVRIIIAPERMPYDFGDGLVGKQDG